MDRNHSAGAKCIVRRPVGIVPRDIGILAIRVVAERNDLPIRLYSDTRRYSVGRDADRPRAAESRVKVAWAATELTWLSITINKLNTVNTASFIFMRSSGLLMFKGNSNLSFVIKSLESYEIFKGEVAGWLDRPRWKSKSLGRSRYGIRRPCSYVVKDEKSERSCVRGSS